MNKKALLITLIVFLAVLGVAAALYPKLSQNMQAQQLAPAPTATAAPTEQTAAAEESTEPELVAAPDFTVLDMDGNEVKFSHYLGKPIVLNFWAYWCGPCQSEMPEFNDTWEALEEEVTFLMVHVGTGVDEGKAKVAEGGYTFPVVFDEKSEAAAIYGITAFPTTFFIDKDGYLQGWYMGAMSADLLQVGIDRIYTP